MTAPRPTAVATALAALGFRHEHTGGNCEAYTRRTPEGVLHLICAECNGWVPDSLTDEPIDVALLTEDGQEIWTVSYPSVAAYLEARS